MDIQALIGNIQSLRDTPFELPKATNSVRITGSTSADTSNKSSSKDTGSSESVDNWSTFDYSGTPIVVTAQEDKVCNAELRFNLKQRAIVVDAQHAKLPHINGLVPSININYNVGLRTSESVSIEHANAQIALVKLGLPLFNMVGTITKNDVEFQDAISSAVIYVEVKPRHGIDDSENMQVASAHWTTSKNNNELFHYFYETNSWVGPFGNPFLTRFVSLVKAQRAMNKSRGLGSSVALALRKCYDSMKGHITNTVQIATTPKEFIPVKLGLIEQTAIALSKPQVAVTPDLSGRGSVKTFHAEDEGNAAQAAVLTAAVDSDVITNETNCFGITKPNGFTPSNYNQPHKAFMTAEHCPKPDEVLEQLYQYNIDKTGIIIGKTGSAMRKIIKRMMSLPSITSMADNLKNRRKLEIQTDIRLAVAKLSCMAILAHELGAMKPLTTTFVGDRWVDVWAYISNLCNFEIKPLDIDPGDLLNVKPKLNGWPSIEHNAISASMYCANSVLRPVEPKLAEALGFIDCNHNGLSTGNVIEQPPSGNLIRYSPGSKANTVEGKRIERLLCPEIINPHGQNSADSFLSDNIRSMAVSLKNGNELDQSVAIIANMIADCCKIRSVNIDHVELPRDDLIAGALTDQRVKHMTNLTVEMYQQGKSGLKPDDVDLIQELGSMRNCRGLINKFHLPPRESGRCSQWWGFVKAHWDNNPDIKFKWPICDSKSLMEHCVLLKANNDPNGTNLRTRSQAFNIAISSWIMRLMRTRSRSNMAVWLAGDNWFCVRIPDPPPNAESRYVPRRAFLAAVAVDKITKPEWAGWLPHPAGWLKAETITGTVIWKVFQLADHEIDSWIQRPLRDDLCNAHLINNPKEGKSGPFDETPMLNILLLAGSIEKRAMQTVSDAVGYCWRGARAAGNLPKLIKKVNDECCTHPVSGLTLGLGVAYAGTCYANAEQLRAVMTWAKSAGTTKASSVVHNRRATAMEVIEHTSFALHLMNDQTY